MTAADESGLDDDWSVYIKRQEKDVASGGSSREAMEGFRMLMYLLEIEVETVHVCWCGFERFRVEHVCSRCRRYGRSAPRRVCTR